MRKKNPREFFNISFLDVITSTGGVFLLLVLIFLAAIFFNTQLGDFNEITLLWSKNKQIVNDITKTQTLLYEYETKLRLKQSDEAIINQGLLISKNNDDVNIKLEKLQELKRIFKAKDDSVNQMKKIAVDLGEKLVGISSPSPQSARLEFLRPALDLEEPSRAWDIITLVKNDSIYSLHSMKDARQFLWHDSLALCWPKPGAGEPVVEGTKDGSVFEEMISDISKGDIVLVLLYDESIQSYPLIRDFILRNKRRVALETKVGTPRVTFGSKENSWTPRPIY